MTTTLPIPESYLDLVTGPHTALLATLLRDGSPQVSPVWFWFDGTHVLVSSRAGRPRHRHLLRDPRVSFTIVDPTKPLRYIEIRGTAHVEDDPEYTVRELVVRKHGYADGSAFDPPGTPRISIRIDADRIVEH